MNIREACDRILGSKLAAAIIADQGLHWAVVAAMCDCRVSHGPAVKAAIDAYNAELKRLGEGGKVGSFQ